MQVFCEYGPLHGKLQDVDDEVLKGLHGPDGREAFGYKDEGGQGYFYVRSQRVMRDGSGADTEVPVFVMDPPRIGRPSGLTG